jgi:hypothetical protein
MPTTKFDGIDAAFWTGAGDAEILHSTEPMDALEEAVDALFAGPCNDAEARRILTEHGPVTVYPWTRVKLDVDVWTENVLDNLTVSLQEDEELSDPDGDWEPIPALVREQYEPRFRALMAELLAEVEPWACERGKGIELSPEEVIDLLELSPEEVIDLLPYTKVSRA